jgi:hypothetical protein
MGTYNLTDDPSFKSFIPGGQETPNDSRVLLQLYECQEQRILYRGCTSLVNRRNGLPLSIPGNGKGS